MYGTPTRGWYRERRWRPIRWWEIAALGDPERMPFRLYFAEMGEMHDTVEPLEDSQIIAEWSLDDPWDEHGEFIADWFARGDHPEFAARHVLFNE